jgi:hypothetical protein
MMRYSPISILTRELEPKIPAKISTPLANFEALTQPPKTC